MTWPCGQTYMCTVMKDVEQTPFSSIFCKSHKYFKEAKAMKINRILKNLSLTCQAQSTPKTIGILTKVFYTYYPNLVILAWTGDEISCGQTWWRTDRWTQAKTIPVGVSRFTGASWCTNIRRPRYISVHWHKCIAILWPEQQCKSPRKKPSNLYWLMLTNFVPNAISWKPTIHVFLPWYFILFCYIFQHIWCGKHNYFHYQFKLLLWPARMWLTAPLW